MIVRALHPGPVRHVPRGGRYDRLDFEALVTQCEIPEYAAGDFELLPRTVLDKAYLKRDGRLWERISQGFGRDRVPVAPANFRSWLEGGKPMGTVSDWLDSVLSRTPLQAQTSRITPAGAVRAMRGVAGPAPLRSREVTWDGCERATQAVRAFLGDEVAIVGGTVCVATHPVGQLYDLKDSVIAVLDHRPHSTDEIARYFDLDRIDEARETYPKLGQSTSRQDLDVVLEAMPEGFSTGSAARYFAHVLPSQVRDAVASLARKDPGAAGHLAATARDLRPYADLASVGMLRPGEMRDALVIGEAGVARIADTPGADPDGMWAIMRDHLRALVIPSFSMDPADEASLRWLSA